MAEMNNNTADLLQQLIDIKDDIRGSIQYKGVNVVGGMIDYPYAIDRIRQDGSTYTYKIPTADVNGLEAIGWDSESIKYYADNNLQYEWLSDYFKVSEENKALYGVVNEEFFRRRNEYGQPIQDLDLQYCPYFDITDATGLFREQFQIKGVPLFDTSSITDMSDMFLGCVGLITIPPLNTSSVTNMSGMLSYCYNLNNIPLFDTSSVTNMNSMFSDCYYLTSIPLFDTSSVTNMGGMFRDCSILKYVPLLDTSKVTGMSTMFSGCESLTTIPPLNFFSAKNTNGIFGGCSNLESIPLLDFGSSTVKMGAMGSSSSSSLLNKLTDVEGFDKLKASWNNYGFEYCPNLTVESLMNIIDHLWDWTDYPDGRAPTNDGRVTSFGTIHRMSFGNVNLVKLTDEQIAVATNKGWTLF